jgi:hypothetical protein
VFTSSDEGEQAAALSCPVTEVSFSGGHNRVGVSLPSPENGNIRFPKLCFTVFRVPGGGISPEIHWLWVFSTQANYTDWATATGQRILVPAFADRGVSRGQRGATPTPVNLSFLDRSSNFFIPVAPHLSSRGWMDSIPGSLLLRKSGTDWNRTRDLWVWRQELCPLITEAVFRN